MKFIYRSNSLKMNYSLIYINHLNRTFRYFRIFSISGGRRLQAQAGEYAKGGRAPSSAKPPRRGQSHKLTGDVVTL